MFFACSGNAVQCAVGCSSYVLMGASGICSLCIPSLLSTLWIPRKILAATVWGKGGQLDEAMLTEVVCSSGGKQKQERQSEVVKSSTKEIKRRLLATFRSKQDFELFIGHIYREFSHETILSYIEMVQFKECVSAYIRRRHLSFADDDEVSTFYEKIPKSSIVFPRESQVEMQTTRASQKIKRLSRMASASTDGPADDPEIHSNDDDFGVDVDVCARFKQAAHLLHEKYIAPYSPFEVNLSCALRKRYSDLDRSHYANLDVFMLANLFDAAKEEMLKYIWQSFLRFDRKKSLD